MVTLQVGLVPADAQSPPQPLNCPGSGVGAALRVTVEPCGKLARQVWPAEQTIPPGLLVTIPGPSTPTLSWRTGGGSKVALTLRLPLMVTVQPPVPPQAPPQPAKTDPAPGVAARVTEVPAS
jgi:hypothetical protein